MTRSMGKFARTYHTRQEKYLASLRAKIARIKDRKERKKEHLTEGKKERDEIVQDSKK